jgi:DNA-directed RNA polymerase I and III subunit RPAC2
LSEGTTASEALEKGLMDLMNLCDVVANKFVEENILFVDKHPDEE